MESTLDPRFDICVNDDMTSTASTPTSTSSISRHRWRWAWIALLVIDVVIWLIADSQGPDLLAFNAQGTFLNVLKVAWALSAIGFILLIAVGIVGLVRSLYVRRTTQRSLMSQRPVSADIQR